MINDDLKFEDGFMCIGGRSFAWVYENRKEFVEFTLEKMKKTTGLFREWKTYCINRRKDG